MGSKPDFEGAASSSAAEGKLQLEEFESRLVAACARRLRGITAIVDLRRLSGGASQETWSFSAIVDGKAEPLVLRRSAPGFPALSGPAIPMDLEAQVIRSAAKAGVPVPEIVAILEPGDSIGSGFVSRFIEGETLGGRICRRPDLERARSVFVQQCASNLAAIHRADLTGLSHVPVVTPAGEVERLRSLHSDQKRPSPVFAYGVRWLETHMIAPADEAVLVHGDYRNGNLIVGQEGVKAILDWEAAHVGDPVEDLAWFCSPAWRFGNLDRPAGGVGSQEQLLADYERSAGRKVDRARLRFWEAFSILRWGLMCASAEAVFSSGADFSPQRAVIARRTSESELDLLRLLLPRA